MKASLLLTFIIFFSIINCQSKNGIFIDSIKCENNPNQYYSIYLPNSANYALLKAEALAALNRNTEVEILLENIKSKSPDAINKWKNIKYLKKFF